MSINIRGIKDTDIALMKKITKETAWKSISEDERRTLNREKWSRHMDEVLERSFKREGSEVLLPKTEITFSLGMCS